MNGARQIATVLLLYSRCGRWDRGNRGSRVRDQRSAGRLKLQVPPWKSSGHHSRSF